ncbi:mechanosensitive ion channel family protein [Sphingomonas asaccharolytica]|uniref:mechanosensitive ion channel family protein n=1 Tax=Sphingomonas asaccharolytica TaxID=40681 RepID=UPI000A00CFF5|nr:mechanosensitive ion channel family protein [Sphingomonas asaccharolytica]
MNNTALPKAADLTASDLRAQTLSLWKTSAAWISAHWLQVLIAIGVGVLIFLALHFVKSLGRRLCNRDKSGTGWYTVFGRAVAKTGNFFIIMTSAELVAAIGDAPYQVAAIVRFLFTVAAVFQGAIWAREIILGGIEHRTAASEDHGETLANAMGLIRLFVTFALFAIALVMILGNLGVNVSGLIAGLGVGGIAIGLAAQSIFADLFAAIAIIFDRPFRRGDAITYDKSAGTVEYIGMRSTRIRGANGEERVIGNKKLLDFEIVNNSRREYRRVIFTLAIVQTTPVDQLEALPHLLKQIVEDHGQKFVRAGFAAFTPTAYEFDLEFDSPTAVFQDMYDARHSIGISIIKRFQEEGIALVYPAQTGISAADSGVTWPTRKKPRRAADDKIAPPPSSGDRSVGDQGAPG